MNFPPNSQLCIVRNESVEQNDGQNGIACVLPHLSFCIFLPHLSSSPLSGEGESSACCLFCGRGGESKILAHQYFHKPSFRSALLMPNLSGICFAMTMGTGLLPLKIFYFKISSLSKMAWGFVREASADKKFPKIVYLNPCKRQTNLSYLFPVRFPPGFILLN